MSTCFKHCNNSCKECHPFLLLFDPKSRDYLKSKMFYKDYEKGDYLFQINEKASSLWLIDTGRVKISNNDINGNERIISIFQKGEVIWESLFLENGKYKFNCITLEKARICKIETEYFEQVINNKNTALKIISLLSKKLHDANIRNQILSNPDPIKRICGFFLYMSQKDNSLVINLKGEDIASSVLLRTETVSRKLSELVDMKIIKKIGQSSYQIIDYSTLVEMSEL